MLGPANYLHTNVAIGYRVQVFLMLYVIAYYGHYALGKRKVLHCMRRIICVYMFVVRQYQLVATEYNILLYVYPWYVG